MWAWRVDPGAYSRGEWAGRDGGDSKHVPASLEWQREREGVRACFQAGLLLSGSSEDLFLAWLFIACVRVVVSCK